MEKLLIVDDTEDIRKQLKWGLGKEYGVSLAGNRQEALALFQKLEPKVVLLDLGLPPHEDGAEEGLTCLAEMLMTSPHAKVIIVTGNEERESALKAIQIGAYDFYQKPIDLKELRVIINRAVHLYNIEDENRRLQSALSSRIGGVGDMIGQCPEMMTVFSTIRKVAPSDAPVLICGDTGTGKELVARAVHFMSLRKEGPFVPINCGAIPENLLESELFGFEKGAFTGAFAQIQGKIEYAQRGTLFLDEVGELSANLQVKLLRFLQEKTFQRVGGRENINVDARIIAATNMEITRAIQEGKFREDLYYRIGVVTITLPPLRERGGDIMLLSNFFLRKLCEEFKRKIKGFSPSSIELLESHPWPGNVRELENRIQRAVIMSETPIIEPQDLGFLERPAKRQESAGEAVTLRQARDMAERDLILKALERHGHNPTRVAEQLGISRPTLYDLLRKHGLYVPHHEGQAGQLPPKIS